MDRWRTFGSRVVFLVSLLFVFLSLSLLLRFRCCPSSGHERRATLDERAARRSMTALLVASKEPCRRQREVHHISSDAVVLLMIIQLGVVMWPCDLRVGSDEAGRVFGFGVLAGSD